MSYSITMGANPLEFPAWDAPGSALASAAVSGVVYLPAWEYLTQPFLGGSVESPAWDASGVLDNKPVVGGTVELPAWGVLQVLAGTVSLPAWDVVSQITTPRTFSAAWVTNLRTGETTRFPNFDYIHLIRIGGHLYGLKADGIYRMGGEETFTPHVKFTPTDFEDERTDALAVKSVPYLYTDGNDSDMTVTTYVDGVRSGRYTSTRKSDRTRLGRGARGRVWQFELQGARINLLRIGALVDVLKRRI